MPLESSKLLVVSAFTLVVAAVLLLAAWQHHARWLHWLAHLRSAVPAQSNRTVSAKSVP